MKVLQINTVDAYGSTGKIARGIYDECIERGIQCKIAHRYHELDVKPEDSVAISSYFDCHAHNRLARITHLTGFFSHLKTAKFLKWVDEYSPDVIHLHNLHGNYINIPMLFNYIKKKNIRLIWTLHDCWAFTGGCPYYTMSGCDKWISGCEECNLYGFGATSKFILKHKKKWFSDIGDVTIVTPSEWLAEEVKKTFLEKYPIMVVNNGIDLNVFRPRENNFRKEYNLINKQIILGVAFDWGKRKGFDVFIELARRLDDKYRIVLVGTNEKNNETLPDNIISINKTNNQTELAEVYSAADLFVIPTREDNFPTVNIESLACGTPVLTFKTGGSPEIPDETCGCVVEVNDIDAMEKEIIRICEGKPYSEKNCVARARQFDKKQKFKEYVDLYERKENITF